MFITNPEEAGFLLDAPEFSYDIETDTEAPNKSWKDGYGLSYVTDITWISFFVGGHPAVVFDMSDANPRKNEIITFIQRIFNRDGYTVIGHNIGFDMRLTGGHYDIHIPLGSRAWDTLTMAILLLMGEDFKGDISLKSLASRYGLFKDVNELEFLERMKTKRDALHLQESNDVMRYVAADTEITWRLYELQKKIIETSPDPLLEPYPVVKDDTVVIDIGQRGSRPKFLSTKKWSTLNELVDWETRISRWSCNAAARGIKLDKNAVTAHLTRLAQEYREALDIVMGMTVSRFPIAKLDQLATLIYYQRIFKYQYSASVRPNAKRWVYKPETWSDIPDLIDWIEADTIDEAIDFANWLQAYPEGRLGWDDTKYLTTPPWINIEGWILKNLFEYEPELKGTSNEILSETMHFKAQITRAWFEHYFTRPTPIDPMKIANMKLFQPFFTFVVCDKDFPTNEQIAQNSEFVTDKLRTLVEKGEDMDYQKAALTTYGWSFGEAAVREYFPKVDPDDRNEPDHPFLALLGHKAMMNRIDEFMRHSERDGRIHSIISRKTRTGRATSVTMNLQNIDMKNYMGYLVPDDGDRVLIGIDISNAENWMLAAIFGDSNLALACASGDFHGQMADAYWHELVQMLKEQDRWDEYKALRKKGKFVTFGSAYGAGARKISRMIGTTKDEAQTLLDNRDKRFANYAAGRSKLAERVAQCYRDGHRPAFTTNWAGRRIAIPMKEVTRRFVKDGKFVEEKKIELAAYKATNYLPQSSVGDIIWRTIVLVSEQLEREGYDAHVVLQVHDEIILDVPVDKAFEIAKIVIDTMYNILPDSFKKRTNPECRILAQFGPENANKWGYRYGQTYPLPTDIFVNHWGTFPMPEGEHEAPTWIGDLSSGYSLENEIATVESEKIDLRDTPTSEARFTIENRWREFPQIVNDIRSALSIIEQYQNVGRLVLDGEDKGLFDFPNRMLIQQELAHKGHQSGNEYWEVLSQIDALESTIKKLSDWKASA